LANSDLRWLVFRNPYLVAHVSLAKMSVLRSLRIESFALAREFTRRAAKVPALARLVGAISRRLVLFTPGRIIEVEGVKMLLSRDRVSLQIALSRAWEPRNTELIKSEIREGEVVVDIGAHIGYFTLILSRLVGPNGCVYAFEPDPDNFAILKRNVEMNGCKNVVLEQKAVSDRAGQGVFVGWNLQGLESAETKESGESKVVDTVVLDEYFRNESRRISFIKIDVEGHELSALRGAQWILRETDGLRILTEFDSFRWGLVGIRPRAYLDFLSELGFDIFLVGSFKKGMVLIRDFDLLLSRFGQMGECLSLFCVKPRMT